MLSPIFRSRNYKTAHSAFQTISHGRVGVADGGAAFQLHNKYEIRIYIDQTRVGDSGETNRDDVLFCKNILFLYGLCFAG